MNLFGNKKNKHWLEEKIETSPIPNWKEAIYSKGDIVFHEGGIWSLYNCCCHNRGFNWFGINRRWSRYYLWNCVNEYCSNNDCTTRTSY